jgi:hypothetical protein
MTLSEHGPLSLLSTTKELLERTSSGSGLENKVYGCMGSFYDRLCGPVVRVLGYRSGGPGSIPGTTRTKVVGLERGPLGLVSTTEELHDRKVAAPV